MKILFIVTILFILQISLSAQVIPTNEWVSFYSSNSTLNGEPLKIGDVIRAYDPDGILCGEFTVHTEGYYGYLNVYKDDFTTPNIDEGAEPGDTISFTINNNKTITYGPSNSVWSSFGDVKELDLVSMSNWPPNFFNLPNEISFRADSSFSLNLSNYILDLDNDLNELSISFELSTDSIYASYNNTSMELVLTAHINFWGEEDLTLRVEDPSGEFAEATIKVFVDLVTSMLDLGEAIPSDFSLYQNYPNPFNPSTKIKFAIPPGLSIYNSEQIVTLTVYDILGRELATLINKPLGAGVYEIEFDATDLPSGVYFYRFTFGDFIQSNKMLLLR